jgi:uncharacterized protein GlcG (DUF336 family)
MTPVAQHPRATEPDSGPPLAPTRPQPRTGVSTADARRMIAAARQAARERPGAMTIVVVDADGGMIDADEMPGAWRDGLDIALAKAFTACTFDLETRRLAPAPPHDGSRPHRDGAELVFAGGIPIHRDGMVVGAVGVCGGWAEDNQACAEAAIVELAAPATPAGR